VHPGCSGPYSIPPGAGISYDDRVVQLISKQDVAHVARLARLGLTEEELERYTTQLAAVLEHAADIAALDIADLPPTAHPLPLANVLRQDVPRPCLPRDEVLAQAPDVEADRFRIPRILGEAP
jgi:aspartyl-tRNA(Asn)/glutamyl-tRNA(Gln) amidotransferase subunit C